MAATVISNTVINKFNKYVTVTTAAACNATDGAVVNIAGAADQRVLLLITNADTANAEMVTIKKGSGLSATADLVISVPVSGVVAAVVESSGFVTGGKITVTGSADVKVQTIVLP